ncbi:hypothetical protein DRO58_04195, partial [Candidatus Bathyarchaeota archaeon]
TGGAPGRWEYWGLNVFEVLSNIILNPTEAVIIMATPIEKPYFVTFLFASAFFLPIFAPIELVLSLPWLVAALLTDYPPYYQPYYQYSAFILGQIFIAAVYGFKNLFQLNKVKINRTHRKMILGLLLSNILLLAAISPVGINAFTKRGIRPYSISELYDIDHIEKLRIAIKLVPPNASIATIWDIFPHVCQRLHAYFIKWPMDYPVEYVLVDLKSPCFSMGIYGKKPDKIVVDYLIKDHNYGILASLDGVLLLQKGYNGPPKYYAPQKETFNYNQLIPASGKIVWDYTAISKKVIRSNPENSIGVVWFGPYKYFSPGSYVATFRIKTANETCRLLLDVVSEEGSNLIVLRTIFGSDFKQVNSWQDFSLRFEIDKPMKLEFRGICFSNSTEVSIDCITVKQLSP